MNQKQIVPTRQPGDRLHAWVLTVGGAIGLLAAFELSIEKIKTLVDPEYAPACDLNPILSCGAVMNTPQGEAFGFPNPFLGLMTFPLVVAVGVAVLGRVKLPRWWWIGMQLGTLFGAGMVTWLFYQSVYNIGALCPWCMAVWVVTIPIFWLTTVRNLRHVRYSEEWREPVLSMLRWHWLGLVLWFAILIALIMFQFGARAIFSF